VNLDGTTTPSVGRSERFPYLEGARGLAAFQVVLTHFASAFLVTLARHGENVTPHYAWESWLAWTPVYFLVDATFAVNLFFIISGFVLAKSFLSGELSFVRQVIKRYLRLNIPSAVASLLALGLLCSFPLARAHAIPLIASPWVTWLYPVPITLSQLVPEMICSIVIGYREYSIFSGFSWMHPLIDPLSIASNLPPLWTLHVEFWGSILVLGMARSYQAAPRALFFIGIAGLLFFLGCSQFSLFVVGFCSYLFRGLFSGQSSKAAFLGAGLAIAVGILMTTSVLPTNSLYLFSTQFAAVPVFLGILLSSQVQALLSVRWVAWLGKISFGLYLVHFPILFTVGFSIFVFLRSYLDYGWCVGLTTVSGVGISLLVATLFEKLVDRPAIRFSRAVVRRRPISPVPATPTPQHQA